MQLAPGVSCALCFRRDDVSFKNSGVSRRENMASCLMLDDLGDGPRNHGLPLYTGSAMEYFTWLNAKLDSIDEMPSSRVSLFFRNAS